MAETSCRGPDCNIDFVLHTRRTPRHAGNSNVTCAGCTTPTRRITRAVFLRYAGGEGGLEGNFDFNSIFHYYRQHVTHEIYRLI